MPPLDDSYSFRSIPRRPPQVPHVSFPPSTCHFYYKRFRVVIGLRLVLQPYPRLQPVNDFCSSGQRFALGLVGSPNPASFRFHLTMDTLAFGYVLPTTGRTPDLHRLETCAAGRTKNHRRTNDPPMVPVSCSIWFFPTAFPFLLPPIHFQMEVCADPLIPSN